MTTTNDADNTMHLNELQTGDDHGTPWLLEVTWDRPPEPDDVVLALLPSVLSRRGSAVEFRFVHPGGHGQAAGLAMEQYMCMWLAKMFDHWHADTDEEPTTVVIKLDVELAR